MMKARIKTEESVRMSRVKDRPRESIWNMPKNSLTKGKLTTASAIRTAWTV